MKYTIGIIAAVIIVGGAAFFLLRGETVAPYTPATAANSTIEYALSDIAQHNTPANCWMAINGYVYDITAFIASGQHNPEINKGCGLDATTMFSREGKHGSSRAHSLMDKYVIGKLKQG
jgi:cytochrome b involved in lipid metabolism